MARRSGSTGPSSSRPWGCWRLGLSCTAPCSAGFNVARGHDPFHRSDREDPVRMTTTTAPQVIEAELGHNEPLGSDAPLDPLAQALRQRGFRSVSIGLRTAQIDGMLYELCPVS